MSKTETTKPVAIVNIIAALPVYTQMSVLYQVLGSLNSSALNTAAREVAADIRNLNAAERNKELARRGNIISIDKYNEMLNELREHELNGEHFVDTGTGEITLEGPTKDVFDEEKGVDHINEEGQHEQVLSVTSHKEKVDRLSLLLDLRAPLLAIFNTAQATLPKGDVMPDFSFQESLARQLAREWSAEQAANAEIDKGLVESGAVTLDELLASDKEAFETDQAFKKETRFLILDKLNDKEPLQADDDAGNAAFEALGWEFGARMLNRMLPKLMDAKRQQLQRRAFDPDAPSNILIIGLAIAEFKRYIGDSQADKKLKAMQEALAA